MHIKNIFKISILVLILLIFCDLKVCAFEKQINKVNQDDGTPTTLENLLKDNEEQKEIEKILQEKSNIAENDNIKLDSNISLKSNAISSQSENPQINYTDNNYINGREFEYTNEYLNIPGLNTGYDYIISYSNNDIKLKKHDIINQTNTEIAKYTSEDIKIQYITYAIRDNILYILYIKGYDRTLSWGTEYDTSWILGIDLAEETIVYEQAFDCPQDNTYLPSFTVDGNENFYFVYRNTGTKIFDKKGNLLFNKEPIANSNLKNYFKSVSPNNKVLFFQVMQLDSSGYAYFYSIYEGMQSLNNGVFTYPDEYTVYSRTYPSNLSFEPKWYFFNPEDSTYAVDQYGRIAKFEYDLTTEMGASREIILDLNSGCLDYCYYEANVPVATYDNGMLYIFGANNNVYRVNSNTFEKEDYIKTGIPVDKDENLLSVYKIRIVNNNLYIHMKDGSSNYYNRGTERCISLDSSNITNFKTILYSEHSSNNHTIDNIVQKYLETKPTFNYSNSIYKIEPVWKEKYIEGTLQDEVVNDGLNKLNYYRWLVTVDDVSLNLERMTNNQKGALLLQKLNKLTHYPSKPDDMDDEFYKAAYEGVNAGRTYSGNVAWNYSNMVTSIMGWIDDIDNISEFSTGHRQSLLDPECTETSFGMAGKYSAMSMYKYESKDITKENYYAYPPAGNFPNTEMKTDQIWSLYEIGTYTGSISVNFIYNNKTYKGYLKSESGYPVMNFKFPPELIQELGGEGKVIPANTSIKVEVVGYKNENFDDVKFEYTVNFFDMDKEVKKAIVGDLDITTIPFVTINNKNIMTFNPKTILESIKTENNFPILAVPYTVNIYNLKGQLKEKTDNIGSKDVIEIKDTDGKGIENFITVVPGDVTGDGYVRMYDSFEILKGAVTGNKGLDEIDYLIRDYNKDGNIRMYDAFQYLREAVSGK